MMHPEVVNWQILLIQNLLHVFLHIVNTSFQCQIIKLINGNYQHNLN